MPAAARRVARLVLAAAELVAYFVALRVTLRVLRDRGVRL